MRKILLLQPNRLVRKIYPQALWHLPRTDKTIYLTFDDGPVPGLTEWVLDELNRFDAKATFFCVGDNILRHRATYNRILEEGHLAANHTMHHVRGTGTTLYSYMKEVQECSALVGNKIFRPPYGQMRRSQYHALRRSGYQVVLWDVISYDYENISAGLCTKNVLQRCKPGSIVLFHDNVKAERNLRAALPQLLETFSMKGYRFKCLPAGGGAKITA